MWTRFAVPILFGFVSGIAALPVPSVRVLSQVSCSPRISTVEDAGGSISYFYAGSDGSVYAATSFPPSTWKRVSGVQTTPCGSVTAVSKQPGEATLFVTDIYWRIMTISIPTSFIDSNYRGSVWTPILGLTAPPGTEVGAISNNENRLHVLVTASDSRIYASRWCPKYGIYTKWAPIGTLLIPDGSPVAAVSLWAGAIDLFVTGSDGHVYTSTFDLGCNCFPFEWEQLKGISALPGSAVTAIVPAQDQILTFVVGIDGRIWRNARGPCGQWGEWSPIGHDFMNAGLGERVSAVAAWNGEGIILAVLGIDGRTKWGKSEDSDIGELVWQDVPNMGTVQIHERDGALVAFGIEGKKEWKVVLIEQRKQQEGIQMEEKGAEMVVQAATSRSSDL